MWEDSPISDITEVSSYPLLKELEIIGSYEVDVDLTPLNVCENLQKLRIIDFTFFVPRDKRYLDRSHIVDINLSVLDALELELLEIDVRRLSVRFILQDSANFECLSLIPMVTTPQNL
ncbi:MAG: hypothetical protein ACW99G_01835 [Candidatus Thorarchaeota archaeon]|jgi:hypothetical protein